MSGGDYTLSQPGDGRLASVLDAARSLLHRLLHR